MSEYTVNDFKKGRPRWCPGCGDHFCPPFVPQYKKSQKTYLVINKLWFHNIYCIGKSEHTQV